MRKTYLVTYDISDPVRLRRVFKLMGRHGDHLQLSVFRCELSPRERVRLESALSDLIKSNEDQVLFADLGPVDGRGGDSITTIGRPYQPIERGAVVI